MSDHKVIIPCPHCGTGNRMPVERRGQDGKCGNCHQKLFTGHPIELDRENFHRHAGSEDLPLLVDFWAEWCGPCRTMVPVFAATAAELEPRLRFGKLDTEAQPEIAARYQIRAIPTMILFKGGREVARQAGAMPGSALRQWIDRHLAA